MAWVIGLSIGAGVLICAGIGCFMLHVIEKNLHPHDWE